MAFGKAQRTQVDLKIALTGTSGAGKTVGALLLAEGISKKCGSRIAFISTEKGRSLYNADKFDYDIEELDDYSPETYIKAIDEAIDAGYKIIIIDSLSHCWQWMNDVHSKMPGNSFQNWGKLKPRYAKLMQKILEAPAHIITCSRAKTEWAMEDRNGKQVPNKVGLGVEGDKQADFEYAVSLMIEQGTHIASVESGGKDNTGLFEGKYEVLTRKHGEMLYDWANSSDIPAQKTEYMKESVDTVPIKVAALKKEVIAKVVELGGNKNEAVKEICAKFGNPNEMEDLDVLNKYMNELNKVKGE